MTDIINDDDSTIDYAALAAGLADESGIDMTKAQKGGGERPIPATGPCRLRFVGYVEQGNQERMSMGKKVVKPRAVLMFEVSGPKHPPMQFEDGTSRPHVIYVEENFGRNEKSNIMKLFTRMNYAGKARHMVGLLGEAFKGVIHHETWEAKGNYPAGKKAVLKTKDTGYTIEAPRTEDPETGDIITLPVAPAATPIKCFVWERPSMPQWKSIFIDGEWEERRDDKGAITKPARSKNVYQEMIRAAKNFEGSPIEQLLAGAGVKLDLPKAESGKAAAGPALAGTDSDDALSGIGAE